MRIMLRIAHCLSLGAFSLYVDSHLVPLSSSFTDFGRLRTDDITWLRLVCEARCIKGRQCCYISCYCCCISFTSKCKRGYKESYPALHLSLCISMSVWLLRERKSGKKKDFPKNQGTLKLLIISIKSGGFLHTHFISFHFIIFIQVKGSYIYMFFNLTCFKRLK